MEEKKLLSRRDALFFAGLLALMGLLSFLFSLSPRGTVAIVERDGEVIATRELSQLTGPEELSIAGENGISLTVRFAPDGASVVSADCPDQTCVRTGKLTRSGETALCLPAKVSLRLTGAEEKADAATY